FPHIVQEVQDLIASKDPSIDELGQIVEKDIVISSKLISIANSPLYKGMDTVDNLSAALLRLGMKTTQSVISAVAARHLFSSSNKPLKQELERLWIHSFATASLAKQIGDAAGSKKTENIFLMGIVHDIGKMLLMKAFVDICPEESISDKQLQMAIHEIHTTFGAVLLKKLRFSQNFIQAVEFHHWNTFEADTDQELPILSVADHLAYELGYGFLRTAEHRISGGSELPQNQDGSAGEEKEESEIETLRTASLERIGQLDALKHLGLTPESVMAIGEQIRPVIKDTAKTF
ncbi:MAG: HDOD domain-containing protein, partial [Desulfobacterales bacterium]|nr:HDOD domain-containing protein [Desulfobacterales bacterium]